MTTKIAIAGANGKMGENLIQSGILNNNTDIVGVFDIEKIDTSFLKKVGLPENTIVPEAQGEASKILRESEAYQSQTVAEAEGQATRFVSIYSEFPYKYMNNIF